MSADQVAVVPAWLHCRDDLVVVAAKASDLHPLAHE